MNQARKLTGTCLEGSLLLRLCEKDTKQKHNIASSEITSSSCDDLALSGFTGLAERTITSNMVKKPDQNSIELKIQIIR